MNNYSQIWLRILNNDEEFYVGIIKTVARAIGWERLRALVERLEREEKGR